MEFNDSKGAIILIFQNLILPKFLILASGPGSSFPTLKSGGSISGRSWSVSSSLLGSRESGLCAGSETKVPLPL